MADARRRQVGGDQVLVAGTAGDCAAVTRRTALLAAASAAGCALMGPAPAFAASEGQEPQGDVLAEFNAPFTAWPGYASTARSSIAPGAVPVKAPTGDSAAWTAELDGSVGEMALRQVGQSTFLYELAGSTLQRMDAATGELLGDVELPSAPCAGSHPIFMEATLAVVLATGQIAVYDETLAEAWVSASPALPGGAASWGPGSQVVSMGGAVHALLVALDAGGAAVGMELLSLAAIDGSPLWRTAISLDARFAAMPSPRLMAAGDRLLLLDGGSMVRLVDIETGEVADEVELSGALEGRFAELPHHADGLAWIAVDSSGEVSVLGLDERGLQVIARSRLAFVDGEMPCPLPFEPAVVRGHAFLWASIAADAASACCIDVTVEEVGAVDVGASLGALPSLPAAPLLATAYGENVRDARVALYALDEQGSIWVYECDSAPVQAVDAAALWSPAGSSPALAASGATSLLVNRDGMLFAALDLAGQDNGGVLVALAPDEARSVATPVGGSEGIDTLGSTLAGIPLPNGAGVGVGAVFLAATFALYSLIRNKGGKRRRDEGVDEWRLQRGEDSDDVDRGSGASW